MRICCRLPLRDMETWLIILGSLCISILFRSLFDLIFPSKTKLKLPPGPPAVPLLGNFLLFRKSFSEVEPIIRNLLAKYGPIITLRIGSRPAVFISDRSIAHQALVQSGAVFSNRPPALPTTKFISSNQHNISSATYGPTWRLLRRNLTSEILHPSRIKSFSLVRKRVLGILINRLKSQGQIVERVVDHFQYAMFCLLVLMCFGDMVEESKVKEIETVQREFILNFNRFNKLNFWPRVGKILFHRRWEELFRLRKNQGDVLIPLIRDRSEAKQSKHQQDESVLTYVDTLFNLELPDEKRKLNEGEIVGLVSEFLTAGTDTTSTALQWIMANLVKNPSVQSKLYDEMNGVLGPVRKEVEEEDLHNMTYLKAVVLEGLRRHPPAHFVIPHAVTQDVKLDGYSMPRNGTINFMVADMGWDPKVWEDPMEFKPERFMGAELFDITGNREIKMMPFGAGRRICPGLGLAMLHLEYFVANLVWCFEWKPVDGDEIDLSEKLQFTMVMKNPLKVQLYPRFN